VNILYQETVEKTIFDVILSKAKNPGMAFKLDSSLHFTSFRSE